MFYYVCKNLIIMCDTLSIGEFKNKVCKVLREWKVLRGRSLFLDCVGFCSQSKKKLKIRFQLLKGFYHIVANVRLAHSSSDRCFGSEVLKYEKKMKWMIWNNQGKCVGMVCKRSCLKKRGVLIDMTRQKLSFIFHRSSVKKVEFFVGNFCCVI